MLPAYDETFAYLEGRYLTLPALAEASGLPAARLEVLIEAGCLPGHSHEAILSLRVETAISGSHVTADKRVRYYHPDLAGLAVEADTLARDLGLAAASAALRERHDAAVALAAGQPCGSPAHRQLADGAWAAWRDGTYGICLQRVSTPDMIRKVLATRRLKAILEDARATTPDAATLQALDAALEDYAAVTGPFGPQERDGSTRALVYEPALALRRSLGGSA
jgi:hypothetical protein